MITFANVDTYEAGLPYQQAKAIIMLLTGAVFTYLKSASLTDMTLTLLLVVNWTDAFGLELNNNLVIADRLAEQTTFSVLSSFR